MSQGAVDLPVRGHGVDDYATVVNYEILQQVDEARLCVNRDHREMGSVATCRRRFRLVEGYHIQSGFHSLRKPRREPYGDVRDFLKADRLPRIPLRADPAPLDVEVLRRLLQKVSRDEQHLIPELPRGFYAGPSRRDGRPARPCPPSVRCLLRISLHHPDILEVHSQSIRYYLCEDCLVRLSLSRHSELRRDLPRGVRGESAGFPTTDGPTERALKTPRARRRVLHVSG